MEDMNIEIGLLIEKTRASIDKLEQAVTSARTHLEKTRPNEEVLNRINLYPSLIRKQRELISELEMNLRNNSYGDIGIIVDKINSLSCMIKDDAKELFDLLSNNIKRKIDDLQVQ